MASHLQVTYGKKTSYPTLISHSTPLHINRAVYCFPALPDVKHTLNYRYLPILGSNAIEL